jgi:GR25 family glycosyltransferase involved in LPS biosynthesis
MNYFIDNVYLINLDKDTERLKKAKEECDKFNIKFQRFPGINPSDLSKNILNKYVPSDILKHGTNGMIGCGLSHLFIWQDAIKNNYDNILVFEDDIKISCDYHKILNNALNELPKDYDILYLGIRDSVCQAPKDTSYNYIYKPTFPLLTHGMIISKNGLKKLVKYIPKITEHIDWTIAKNIDKLNIYATKKKIVNQIWETSSNSNLLQFPKILNYYLSKVKNCHNMPLNYEYNFQLYKYKDYKITVMTYIILLIGTLSNIHKSILLLFLMYFVYDFDKFNLIVFLLGYLIGNIIFFNFNKLKLNIYIQFIFFLMIVGIFLKNNILLLIIKLLMK